MNVERIVRWLGEEEEVLGHDPAAMDTALSRIHQRKLLEVSTRVACSLVDGGTRYPRDDSEKASLIAGLLIRNAAKADLPEWAKAGAGSE